MLLPQGVSEPADSFGIVVCVGDEDLRLVHGKPRHHRYLPGSMRRGEPTVVARLARAAYRLSPPSPLPLGRIPTRVHDGDHEDDVAFNDIVDSIRESPKQSAPDTKLHDLVSERPVDDAVVC